MLKKSFLFGLGVGIILVSVVIYIVSGLEAKPVSANVQPMSEAEIVEKAKALGMVYIKEATAEGDPQETESTPSPTPAATPSATPEATQSPTETPETDEPATATPSPTPVPEPEPTRPPVIHDGYVEVFIPAGSASHEIARILESAGLVDDAVGFDMYIASQGKTGRLMAGWFDVPTDADYETVLGIILQLSKRNR